MSAVRSARSPARSSPTSPTQERPAPRCARGARSRARSPPPRAIASPASSIVTGSALKPSGLGGFANARLDLIGPDLHAFMKRAAHGLTRINAFGEELPNIENRIELVSDKDEFGMPLAKIIHSYDQDVVAVWHGKLQGGLRIVTATGAT